MKRDTKNRLILLVKFVRKYNKAKNYINMQIERIWGQIYKSLDSWYYAYEINPASLYLWPHDICLGVRAQIMLLYKSPSFSVLRKDLTIFNLISSFAAPQGIHIFDWNGGFSAELCLSPPLALSIRLVNACNLRQYIPYEDEDTNCTYDVQSKCAYLSLNAFITTSRIL